MCTQPQAPYRVFRAPPDRTTLSCCISLAIPAPNTTPAPHCRATGPCRSAAQGTCNDVDLSGQATWAERQTTCGEQAGCEYATYCPSADEYGASTCDADRGPGAVGDTSDNGLPSHSPYPIVEETARNGAGTDGGNFVTSHFHCELVDASIEKVCCTDPDVPCVNGLPDDCPSTACAISIMAWDDNCHADQTPSPVSSNRLTGTVIGVDSTEYSRTHEAYRKIVQSCQEFQTAGVAADPQDLDMVAYSDPLQNQDTACLGANDGTGNECALNGNRFSASILNMKLWRAGGHLFSASKSGVVYAPGGVQLNCVYNSDGGSRDGTALCLGDTAGWLAVFDFAAWRTEPLSPPQQETQIGAAIAAVAFSDDDGRLLTICVSGPLEVRDARGEGLPLLRTLDFRGPGSTLGSCQLCCAGGLAVAVGGDGLARRRDVDSMRIYYYCRTSPT